MTRRLIIIIQKAIEKIRPIILQLAKDSALREKMKMPIRATVCVDGSWDHKRDGKLLVYDVICIELQKIVDFEVIVRKTPKRKGNYIISPQAMEGEAFLNLLPRLTENTNIYERQFYILITEDIGLKIFTLN